MNQDIYERLKEIRCSAMAEEYKLLSEDPKSQKMTFEERFSQIVYRECDSRANNTIERYKKAATFHDSNASLDKINYRSDRNIDKGMIDELATNQYIREGLNIILVGASGSGKTWISNAFGMNACLSRYRVKYMRLPDLFQILEEARIQGTYRKTMKSYGNYDLLILDEFLLTKPNETERSDLFEIIQVRTDKKSTIFCSQWSPEGWFDKLGKGPVAEAILDRVNNSSYKILLNGRSMREEYSKLKK